MSESSKKLSELRISDLVVELERRKLDNVGAKATLVERLEEALKKEGLDPSKHLFVLGDKSVSSNAESVVTVKEEPLEEEGENEFDSNGNDNDDEEEDKNDNETIDDEIDQVGDVDEECIIIDNETTQTVVIVECKEENAESSNVDNEESINLTIEEEEQKLLHDQASDEKDKLPDTSPNQKEKGPLKDSKNEKSVHINKEDKKNKDDDTSKIKKKEDKAAEKKEKPDSEQKSSSTKSAHKDDKEKSSNVSSSNAANTSTKSLSSGKTTSASRNLWVSGLSPLTRASDLKTIFSKYGKVIGAKVVTNTRTPGTRCYGYVTMSSSNDASRCIDHLHRTELHGRIISVERTKNEIGSNISTGASKSLNSRLEFKRDEEKKVHADKDDTNKNDTEKRKNESMKKEKPKKDEADKNAEKDDKEERTKDEKRCSESSSIKRRSRRSRSHSQNRDHDREREQRQRERERERERIRQREILSYKKIREERERQRMREREREQREEERRRREVRDRQRQEEHRLAEERKKLSLERERLEREKAELLRLERERQKLEREKIELERLELKRQQMKIMQSREDPLKRLGKRIETDRYSDVSDRKRSSGNESRFEAPPPPRFDASLVSSRSYEKKRDDYSSSSSLKRGMEDYSSINKRNDYSKRDDYTSSTTKRTAIDNYSSIPSKRNSVEYTKRSSNDYIPSTSTKREEYKRDIEIRHIPPSSVLNNAIHKSSGSSRYNESDRTSTSYRRNGLNDLRSSSSKRYENSNSYAIGSTNNNGTVWVSPTHMSHSGNGATAMKSYGSNGMSTIHNASWQKPPEEQSWRPVQSNQDRYDRTYNERSGGYSAGNMYGNTGRPMQDRYGAQMSRY